MEKLSRLIVFILIGTVSFSCVPAKKTTDVISAPEIRNIIFMIGDGMGLATVYAAMSVSDRPLNFERCTYVGLQKTFSADNYITDSAASGTALSSGKKTNNGMIGTGPNGEIYKSILEIAESKGLSTGLVSTSAITHATPASFISHDSSRGNYEAIAMDFLKTDIDVFIGGGYDHFAVRKDSLNLIDNLKKAGYQVETSMDGILKSQSDKLAGFTNRGNNPYRMKGRGNMLPLSTGKAIEILSKNRKGFFLMVEGSEIDFAAHEENSQILIDETLDFDEAVGKAIDFAEKDGHTLVVVTADHETGGVSIVGGDMQRHEVVLNFGTKGHSAILIPVYAYGPGAELFTGIYDNTDFLDKFLKAYGF